MTPSFAGVTSSSSFQDLFYSKQFLRFSLRETVQDILSGQKDLKSIQNCGSNKSSIPAIFVPVSSDANPYFLSETCRSASCPYCSCKLGKNRLEDLEDGIKSFMTLFSMGTIAMMVLTFSHCASDVLFDIGFRFAEAKKLFFRQRGVNEILHSLGIVGRVTAPETTWSILNGFHPHEHILFFFEASVSDEKLEEYRHLLASYWVSACRTFGLNTDSERFYFKRGISSNLTEYVTKCAREVTLSDCKKAVKVGNVERYTPFQLASAFEQTKDSIYAEKFKEYALFVKGRKSHAWSKGLAKTLGVKNYSDDEILSEAPEASFSILFHNDEFRKLSARAKVALLSACKSGSNSAERLCNFLAYSEANGLKDSVSSFDINGKNHPADAVFSMHKAGQGVNYES